MWYGISVMGNRYKPQDSIHQGIITMKNGGTISHALHGISLFDDVFGDAHNTSGGIARISDAKFINNKSSIAWNSYHNTIKHPSGTIAMFLPNQSFVSNSGFMVNDSFPIISGRREPDHQVSMFDMDRIEIRGSNFTYNGTFTGLTDDSKIRGILSVGSHLAVDHTYTRASPFAPMVTVNRGFFKDFNTGVEGSIFNNTAKLSIQRSTFNANNSGVVVNGVNTALVTNDSFFVTDPAGPSLSSQGVLLYGSGLFEVHHNYFEGNNSVSNKLGVRIKNCGSDNNMVRNNYYHNIFLANYSDGLNTNGVFDEENPLASTGLEFRCNTYNDNYEDLVMCNEYVRMLNNSRGDGIRRLQGNPAGDKFPDGDPVGNRFLKRTADHVVLHYNAFDPVAHLQVQPVNGYYYDSLNPVERPVRVSPDVTTFGLNKVAECENLGGGNPDNLTTPGSPLTPATSDNPHGAQELRRRLSDAYDDYTENRFTLINTALTDLNSPYAEVDRALLHMQYLRVAEGLNIYNNILSNYTLSMQETNEFTIGSLLINMLASRYTDTTTNWRILDSAAADTLRYIRDNTIMWANARACSWLSLALNEGCAMVPPVLDDSFNIDNRNLMRRASGEGTANESELFNILPNPASTELTLHYTVTAPSAFVCINMQGVEVARVPLSEKSNRASMNIQHWPSGTYIYRIITNNEPVYYGKLLKN